MVIGVAKSSDTPHVIVVGNEKGGSGKTTIAMHVALALLKAGHRVATIDLDARRQTLTHFLENRRDWARRKHLALELPTHACVRLQTRSRLVADDERAAVVAFERALESIDNRHAFLVVDTPSLDCHATRLAHAMSDTLVTPLNDSFLDLDALTKLDVITLEATGRSKYAEMVRIARRERRRLDGVLNDWIILCSRMPPFGVRPPRPTAPAFDCLSKSLGCRLADGLPERAIYQEQFPQGLTALDAASTGDRETCEQARREVQDLVTGLRLPIKTAERTVTCARRTELAETADEAVKTRVRRSSLCDTGPHGDRAEVGTHARQTAAGTIRAARRNREPPLGRL